MLAIPVYFGSMGAEYLWMRSKQEELQGSPGLYERKDTIASLTMGVGSLLGPLVAPALLKKVVPGKGKYGKVLVTTALSAAAVTTLADLLARWEDESTGPAGESDGGAGAENLPRTLRGRLAEVARPVAAVGGVASVVAGGLAATTSWASRTGMDRLARRRRVRSLGTGPIAVAGAVLAWDFIYYWNHRAMHESRFMWAIHVVHHSSERYNLSTALRQPVADAFGIFLPYSALTLLGFEPALVNTARGVNLIYQFWIHTETIDKIGRLESVLNTPSHHRVHHGSNGPYLDRNHGSILIIWDKLFGTFEPEGDRVVYGLTKNINTFNPLRIAGHEYGEMFRDIARSRTWRDRFSFVVRGPGWAARRRAEQLGQASGAAGGVAEPGGQDETSAPPVSSVPADATTSGARKVPVTVPAAS